MQPEVDTNSRGRTRDRPLARHMLYLTATVDMEPES